MAHQDSPKAGTIIAWVGIVGVMLAAIGLSRLDRTPASPRPSASQPTVRLPDSVRHPPNASEFRDAAADLDKAAARAREASAELERIKAELDEKQKALESVKADADANAERTKRELEDARADLESRRVDLEKASRDAEAMVRSASRDLERLRSQSLAMPAITTPPPGKLPSIRLPRAAPLDPRRAGGFPSPPTMPTFPSMPGTPLPSVSRPAITTDQAARVAAAAAPRRLSTDELNRSTGKITWPEALTEPRYAGFTAAIENLFRERAARGGAFDPVEQTQVTDAIDRLAKQLRDDVRNHSSGRYGAAQTFLDSLRVEADVPTGS